MALVETSRTLLHKSWDTGHPCLVPDVSVTASSVSPFSTMMAGGAPHAALAVLRRAPPAPKLSNIVDHESEACFTSVLCIAE